MNGIEIFLGSGAAVARVRPTAAAQVQSPDWAEAMCEQFRQFFCRRPVVSSGFLHQRTESSFHRLDMTLAAAEALNPYNINQTILGKAVLTVECCSVVISAFVWLCGKLHAAPGRARAPGLAALRRGEPTRPAGVGLNLARLKQRRHASTPSPNNNHGESYYTERVLFESYQPNFESL